MQMFKRTLHSHLLSPSYKMCLCKTMQKLFCAGKNHSDCSNVIQDEQPDFHTTKRTFYCAKFWYQKLKTTLPSKICFPFYGLKICLLSLDFCPSGSFPRKTVFVMFYICKMEITHASVASS